MIFVAASLLTLSLLVWTAVVYAWRRKSGTEGSPRHHGGLYAVCISAEIQRPTHRLLSVDPGYLRDLFRRYAPLLKSDMRMLMHQGCGFSCRLWYACFCLHYAFFLYPPARWLPWSGRDLDLLLALVWQAARRTCSSPGARS